MWYPKKMNNKSVIISHYNQGMSAKLRFKISRIFEFLMYSKDNISIIVVDPITFFWIMYLPDRLFLLIELRGK